MLEKIPARFLRTLKIGAAIAVLPGMVGLWNYAANHNTRIQTGDTLYLKKMDGALAHAQLDLSYSRGDIILEVADPFGAGSRRYTDQGRDGTLDDFTIYRPLFQVSGVEGSFNRGEDLHTHPEIFVQENQRYQQHLKEFAQQFPQDIKRMGLEKALTP